MVRGSSGFHYDVLKIVGKLCHFLSWRTRRRYGNFALCIDKYLNKTAKYVIDLLVIVYISKSHQKYFQVMRYEAGLEKSRKCQVVSQSSAADHFQIGWTSVTIPQENASCHRCETNCYARGKSCPYFTRIMTFIDFKYRYPLVWWSAAKWIIQVNSCLPLQTKTTSQWNG